MKNFVISAAVLSLISSASLAIPPHPHPVEKVVVVGADVKKGLEHKVEKIEDKVDEAKNNSAKEVKPKTTTTESDVPVYPINTLAIMNAIAALVFIHGGPSN